MVIDLSGRKGLGDKYYGDINNFGATGDKSLGQPQYRVNVKDTNQNKDGTMVSGIYNPLRKYGFLSPSVATMYPITYSPTTINKTFTYDGMASPPLALILSSITSFATGTPVSFTTTGTLPSGLALNTIYWTIYYDSTHMKIASSLANALAGTAIDPVDAGTGTHTVTSVTIDPTTIAGTQYDVTNNKSYFLGGLTAGGRIPLFMLNSIDAETPYVDRFLPSAATAGGDLEIYTLSDGTSSNRCLFYSYRSTGGWRAGYKQLDNNTGGTGAGTYVDNWLGSGGTVTGTFEPNLSGEMKFVVGGDGFMYILNGYSVHRVDGTTLGGTNGTITRDVLLAPTYFRFTHGVDFRGNLYFAMQRSDINAVHNATDKEGGAYVQECGVYIWNRQASFSNTSDYIPINGVREIRALWVSPQNDIRCITVSANGVTQIRIFDGTQFKVCKELGATAYPSYSDSLAVISGFTVWLGYDGILYYHGNESVSINITGYGSVQTEPEFLFMMGSVGGTGLQNVLASSILYTGSSGFSTSGTLEKPHPEAFHLFYNIASTPTWSKYFPHANQAIVGGSTVATAANVTPIKTPVRMVPPLSTLKHITVFMARETGLTPGIDDADFSIYINGNTTALMTKTITTTDIMKGYFKIEVNQPFVDCLQFGIVYKNTPTTNFRFNPSYAVVDYVPTDTIR